MKTHTIVPPLTPFSDDGGLCRDLHNGLHSFQSRCSTLFFTLRNNRVLPRRTDCPHQCVVCICAPQVGHVSRRHLGCLCRVPFCPFTQTWNTDLQLVLHRNIHQPTQHLHLYTSGFSSGLRCTTQYKRPSLEEPFIMRSRLGLACSHAPSHSLCELPPLKPPLIVLGTVVQVFSSLRGLCSMLQWRSMAAAPCHVPLPSCSASSDSVLVLCDACADSVVDLWTHDVCSDCVFPAAQV